MIDQPFSEAQRQLLRSLVMSELSRCNNQAEVDELVDLLALLTGVDTVLVAHRAYKAKTQ
jgi:hypothetical protein